MKYIVLICHAQSFHDDLGKFNACFVIPPCTIAIGIANPGWSLLVPWEFQPFFLLGWYGMEGVWSHGLAGWSLMKLEKPGHRIIL